MNVRSHSSEQRKVGPRAQAALQKETKRRESARATLSTSRRWEFRSGTGFFDSVVVDLSEGGMFVSSANPQLPGSAVEFEVRFADGMPSIGGRGRIVWTCDRTVQTDQVSGMGIRFVELYGDSLAVVRSAIEQRL